MGRTLSIVYDHNIACLGLSCPQQAPLTSRLVFDGQDQQEASNFFANQYTWLSAVESMRNEPENKFNEVYNMLTDTTSSQIDELLLNSYSDRPIWQNNPTSQCNSALSMSIGSID